MATITDRIIQILWFALLFPYSSTHTYFQVCNSLFDEKTLRWMPVIAATPSKDNHFCKKRSMLAVFPILKDFSCWCPSVQGIPSRRAGRSRTLSFSVGFSFLVWIVFHSTLVSSSTLTFFVVICTQSPLFLFLVHLDLPLAAAAPEEGFSSCFSREEKFVS